MEPIKTIISQIIPMPYNDVDTDQIIPAEYLKVTDKAGLVDGLFSRWRYLPDRSPDPNFPLNQEAYQNAQILVAGDNFGCGSSREHAPWALAGWGIRAIISSSFADIFKNNAMKNGLLPVEIDPETLQDLFDLAEESTQAMVTINLEKQTVTFTGGKTVTFPIDPFNKECLLEGVDQLGYLLKKEELISRYESQRKLIPQIG